MIHLNEIRQALCGSLEEATGLSVCTGDSGEETSRLELTLFPCRTDYRQGGAFVNREIQATVRFHTAEGALAEEIYGAAGRIESAVAPFCFFSERRVSVPEVTVNREAETLIFSFSLVFTDTIEVEDCEFMQELHMN